MLQIKFFDEEKIIVKKKKKTLVNLNGNFF